MGKTTPEEMLRRWFEEVWNARRLELAEELLAPGAILHEASLTGEALVGAEAFQAHARALLEAIPDLHFELEQVVAQGDAAAGRMIVTGRLSGRGLGVEPTGQSFRISGMAMGRYRDGRLLEGWNNFDLLGLFAQIDAVKRPKLPLAGE
jgi:predicted ester cyclase